MSDTWGKVKEQYFNFDSIREYFDYNEDEHSAFTLSDKVAKDLDLDRFFQYIDRTSSAIGQQYLYDKIRNIKTSVAERTTFEKKLAYFETQTEQSSKVEDILKTLSSGSDYYFPFLIFGALPPKINFIGLVRAMQFLNITFLLLCFYYRLFFLPLLLVFMGSVFLHYWHKNRIGAFAHIFYRLHRLTGTSKQLLALGLEDDSTEIKGSIKAVEQMLSNILLLKTDSLQENEITAAIWYLVELLKIFTLSEILVFHKLVDQIEERRLHIKRLYTFIGETDAARSTASLRADLPYFCRPHFTAAQKEIKLDALYHPLVEGCVPNDIHLCQKGLLLTGSNMSGKSTFIKAINLNIIAAQSLYTAFAKSYALPPLALCTSIKIQDDINLSKSYYLEEVDSVGAIIQKSESEEIQHLFTIDEVFKGTNTIERISAAKAILSYLNQHNHIVLVSTHDIELTLLLDTEYALYYFQESVKDESLSFDYKLKEGELKEKNAIKILELSGYPMSVIEEAKVLANRIEQEKQGTALRGK